MQTITNGGPDFGEKVRVAELLPLLFTQTARFEIIGLYLHVNCRKAGLARHPEPSVVLAPEPSIVSFMDLKLTHMKKIEPSPLNVRHRVFQFDAAVCFTEGILYTLLRELQISGIADIVTGRA